jgi:hypothetical protein
MGRWLNGLVATFALANVALAASISLEPVKDNTLSADDPAYASGAGEYLFIGAIASGGARRALLQFDLSAIPAGSIVTSVSLRIAVQRAAPQSGSDPAALHRLLADWGEGTSDGGTGGGLTQASPGDATWAYRYYGSPPGIPRVPWAAAGGDFDPAASGTTTLLGVGTYLFGSTPRLVADVQGWVDQPATNFGWVMRGEEARSQTARRIFARTTAALSERPLLSVEYLPATHDSADIPLMPWVGTLALSALLGAAGLLAVRGRT